MKFGVCGGVELMPLAAQLGYDYLEMNVGSFLRPAEDEASFAREVAKVKAGALPCLALNCLLPATLNVVGPTVDTAALQAHVNAVCVRAQRAGVRVIVFGSGAARGVPEGFDRGRAQAQLRAFCLMLGQAAAAHHLTIAVEPLRSSECNMLNSVGEVAALVRSVQHPAIRLLVDAFHWMQENDTADAIIANADLLVHAHIATTAHRKAPGIEPCDFAPFFRALRAAKYHGTISIEAGLENPAESLPRALALLQAAAHSSEY